MTYENLVVKGDFTMKRKTFKTRNLSSTLLGSSFILFSATATAATGTTPLASNKINFTVSGQVNRALTFADNGKDSDTLFVDNTNSGSRVRIVGETSLGPNAAAGINIETQFEDNKGSALDIDGADNNNVFTSRKRDLWLKGGWGKLSLGKGDGAANNTSESDNSGTWIANNAGDFLHGGLSFADKTGAKVIKMGKVFSDFDGFSRNNRFRYDTPQYGPLGIAVSKTGRGSELGLTYKQSLSGGSKLTGALGYVKESKTDFKQLGLSVSYLMANGFNITGHYGKRDPDKTSVDPKGTYVKVGQKMGIAKNHMVSVGYHIVNDLAQVGDKAKRVNASYVYLMPKRRIELFGDIQQAKLERTAGDLEALNTVSLGSRIKF